MARRQAENKRKVSCDVCGFIYKFDQLKKRWDGLMVCDNDYETRHPQDFIKIPEPEKAPDWIRPDVLTETVTVDYIDSSVGNQVTSMPTGTFNNEL